MCSSGLTVRFPNKARYGAGARGALTSYLGSIGVDRNTICNLEHAAGEAIANAIEHGHRAGTFFEIRVRLRRSVVHIEIEDDGEGFDPSGLPPSSSRGRGIGMMRTLVDSVEFFKNGRVVRLGKRLKIALTCEGVQAC